MADGVSVKEGKDSAKPVAATTVLTK